MTTPTHMILYGVYALVLYFACATLSRAQDLPNPFPAGAVVTLPPLANGLHIVLRENHALPIVAMEVVMHTGSAAEVGMPGVAHYLEHVSFEGTEHFPDRFAPQYALECVGGISNAVTRRDVIRYNGVVASDHVSMLANVLADIVLHPLLTDASVAAQRPVIIAEYQHQMLDPMTALVNTAYSITFPGHPYGIAPIGVLQDIAQVTPAMVRDFHTHWFTPNNMTVVLVGDITPERAYALLRQSFADVPASVLPAVSALDYRFTGAAVNTHLSWNLPTTYQVMVFPTPAATDFKSFVTTLVLAALLINSEHALLPATWANAGLHIGLYGQEYVGVKYPGRLLIWAQTPPSEADALYQSSLAALAELSKNQLLAQDVAEAKAALAQRFLYENATYSDQAATLASYAGLGDVANATDYIATVQAVTAADVHALIPTTYLARITLGP